MFLFFFVLVSYLVHTFFLLPPSKSPEQDLLRSYTWVLSLKKLPSPSSLQFLGSSLPSCSRTTLSFKDGKLGSLHQLYPDTASYTDVTCCHQPPVGRLGKLVANLLPASSQTDVEKATLAVELNLDRSHCHREEDLRFESFILKDRRSQSPYPKKIISSSAAISVQNLQVRRSMFFRFLFLIMSISGSRKNLFSPFESQACVCCSAPTRLILALVFFTAMA